MNYYDRLIDACLAANIEPVVTLFVSPTWSAVEFSNVDTPQLPLGQCELVSGAPRCGVLTFSQAPRTGQKLRVVHRRRGPSWNRLRELRFDCVSPLWPEGQEMDHLQRESCPGCAEPRPIDVRTPQEPRIYCASVGYVPYTLRSASFARSKTSTSGLPQLSAWGQQHDSAVPVHVQCPRPVSFQWRASEADIIRPRFSRRTVEPSQRIAHSWERDWSRVAKSLSRATTIGFAACVCSRSRLVADSSSSPSPTPVTRRTCEPRIVTQRSRSESLHSQSTVCPPCKSTPVASC